MSRRALAEDVLLRSLLPVLLALLAGAAIVGALGTNPLRFYADIYSAGIEFGAWEDTLMRLAPLLLIACGLIVVFRAGIWNLGIDGQFLLGAVMVGGFAVSFEERLPNGLMLVFMFLIAGAVGAVWTLAPAVLKARFGLNEIITTLMVTFIGTYTANILVKKPFKDEGNVPQTPALDFESLLPSIPGTRIHVGVLVAGFCALVVWYVMGRTAFGLRLQVLGANPRAAQHLGLNVPVLIMVAFLASGFLIGLGGAAEVLGYQGYVRADWNPAFGLLVVPLVFLARMHALAVIPFVFLLSVLSVGGDFATQQAGISNEFVLVLMGLLLLFMALTEWLGRHRALGRSYLPRRGRPARAAPAAAAVHPGAEAS